MKRRSRINNAARQRALMWEKCQQGNSLHDIARLFDRHHFSISEVIERYGGIRPRDRQRAKI